MNPHGKYYTLDAPKPSLGCKGPYIPIGESAHGSTV